MDKSNIKKSSEYVKHRNRVDAISTNFMDFNWAVGILKRELENLKYNKNSRIGKLYTKAIDEIEAEKALALKKSNISIAKGDKVNLPGMTVKGTVEKVFEGYVIVSLPNGMLSEVRKSLIT
ncbi:MAG TPA: hypothetical protein VF181_09340 [Balneolaceae bacterium]